MENKAVTVSDFALEFPGVEKVEEKETDAYWQTEFAKAKRSAELHKELYHKMKSIADELNQLLVMALELLPKDEQQAK